jgi:hypothetical protein
MPTHVADSRADLPPCSRRVNDGYLWIWNFWRKKTRLVAGLMETSRKTQFHVTRCLPGEYDHQEKFRLHLSQVIIYS